MCEHPENEFLHNHHGHPVGGVAVVTDPKSTGESPTELVGGIDSPDPVLAALSVGLTALVGDDASTARALGGTEGRKD